jgi:tetratricopeptide (TPR) repeat protein
VEQVAIALNNRAVVYGQQGAPEKALSDYKRVIEDLPGAPVKQVAIALVNRAMAYGRQGAPEEEWSDYKRVIEDLPGAPEEYVAHAFGSRAWSHYKAGRFDAFLLETGEALARQPKLDFAVFNRCLALLALGRDHEALEHYRKAILEFPKKIQSARKDVEEAIGKWLTPERAKPVLDIFPVASS